MDYFLDVTKKCNVEVFDVDTGGAVYKFGRGVFIDTNELDLDNWERTYGEWFQAGYHPKVNAMSKTALSARSSGLATFGSTITASHVEAYHTPKQNGAGTTMLPRIIAKC